MNNLFSKQITIEKLKKNKQFQFDFANINILEDLHLSIKQKGLEEWEIE